MSVFFDQLEAALDATRDSDRQLSVATTVEIEFASAAVRLWGGRGEMTTPDGQTWIGFIGGPDGKQVFLQVAETEDPRSGNAPLYNLALGYMSAEQYAQIRENEEEVDGRLIKFGYVYLPDQVGTNALTNPGGIERHRMVGRAKFSEGRVRLPDGSQKLTHSVSVKHKNFNGGRSRLSFSTFTDTGQKFRSEILFGVANDRYAGFVAKYAGGYKISI